MNIGLTKPLAANDRNHMFLQLKFCQGPGVITQAGHTDSLSYVAYARTQISEFRVS